MSDQTNNQTGEKALRIGVIQGVRVIEERIVRKKAPLTFGTADNNTFAFTSADLEKSTLVFDVKEGAYELVLTDAMQGRLEGPGGKQDFAALKALAPKVDGTYRIRLAETSKGRVKLSPEVTVLFHFVVPPPLVAVAEMPSELKGGFLRHVEPIFTAVLTASFLVHFAFGVFVRFAEPPAPPTVDDFKELVERIKPPKVEVKLPPPKVVDTGPAVGTGPAEPTTAPKGDGSGGDGGGEKSGGKGKGTGGDGGSGDRNAIREGIAGKGILQLIGGRGGGGGDGAVGSVFGAGGGISDDIGGALQGTAGVGIAGGSGGSAGVTRRGTGGGGGGGDGSGGEGGGAVGIGDLKTDGGGKVDTGNKTAARVVARVRSDDIETVDGKIDKKSVAATIRRRQDGFQACYETALKVNSKLKGKLIVEFTIGETGKVIDANIAKDGLGSAEVGSCVIGLLKRLRFPAPSDGEVTISNTFVFQPG